jgi:hypothetical protein
MEPDCSLPCLQDPATTSYPKLDESSSNLPPLFL